MTTLSSLFHPSSICLARCFVCFCSKVLIRANRMLEFRCFECLREVLSSTLPQGLSHWQVISTLKYVLHFDFFDLVGNKSYNNLFWAPFVRSLLKNIGPWSKRNALASSGVTNDRGPIFFSNDRTKGYYRVSNTINLSF